ncbi:hypothetical protein [Mesorhizobium loti]|nr:hypothetical protein [Mesorhizobium loti]
MDDARNPNSERIEAAIVDRRQHVFRSFGSLGSASKKLAAA